MPLEFVASSRQNLPRTNFTHPASPVISGHQLNIISHFNAHKASIMSVKTPLSGGWGCMGITNCHQFALYGPEPINSHITLAFAAFYDL